MKFRFISQLRRTARNCVRPRRAHCAILLYHHVADVEADPFSLCVSPNHFAEHLQILLKLGRPVPLDQLVDKLRRGEPSEGAVAITFDDGYSDVATAAAPLLERYGATATLFVVADAVGREQEFWWDQLEQLLLIPGTLPQTLRVTSQGQVHEWALDESANYSMESARKYRRWRFDDAEAPTGRHRLFRDLYAWLRELRDCERREVLAFLWRWAERKAVCRPTHGPLTLQELSGLASGGIVAIGAHTMTHADLSRLSPVEQYLEISNSKAWLTESCQKEISAFSYPYGDYEPATIAAVQRADFQLACSCDASPVVADDIDLFQLPRLTITDCDGEGLARRLRQCCSWSSLML